MLAEDCKDCTPKEKFECGKQFITARKNDIIYCRKDGSRMLVKVEY